MWRPPGIVMVLGCITLLLVQNSVDAVANGSRALSVTERAKPVASPHPASGFRPSATFPHLLRMGEGKEIPSPARSKWERMDEAASSRQGRVRATSSSQTRRKLAQVHRLTTQVRRHKQAPADLLQRLALHLKGVVGRMKRWGYELDESYCHVGAAYTTAYLGTLGVEAHLFQPLPFHMLAYFDYRGKRYYLDQTMAQFFKKNSPPHKLLMQQGGFFGTADDFYRFYYKHADHVKEWDNYGDGGYLPKESKPEDTDGVVSYERWETKVDWKKLHSRESRARRIIYSWYKDFRTDTSHNQSTGLFWTAKYFYNIFQVKLSLPEAPYHIP